MIIGIMTSLLQGLIADQAQSLAKEHILSKAEELLDEDQRKALDDAISEATETGAAKSLKDLF